MEMWIKSSYSGPNGGDCVEVAANWRKSSYSGAIHQDCVEVGANWHKSSYSGGAHQDCVEVAESPQQVKVRDTQHRGAGHLTVPATEWSAFLADIKDGQL